MGLGHPLQWQTGCDAGGKESACRSKRHKRQGPDPWVGKIWRRKWQLQDSYLEDPRDRGAWRLQLQKVNTTERVCTHTHTQTHTHTPPNTKPGGRTCCYSGQDSTLPMQSAQVQSLGGNTTIKTQSNQRNIKTKKKQQPWERDGRAQEVKGHLLPGSTVCAPGVLLQAKLTTLDIIQIPGLMRAGTHLTATLYHSQPGLCTQYVSTKAVTSYHLRLSINVTPYPCCDWTYGRPARSPPAIV